MKRVLLPIIVAVFLLAMSAPRLFAGVVMAETSMARGPAGEATLQNRTVYVQGNKQKVERREVAAITDLDKNLIYIVDKKDHSYTEVPLQSVATSVPDGPSMTVRLNKTGETRVIANQQCREYRAIEKNKVERIAITACVSTSAPGAQEISAFERKMVQRLNGASSNASSKEQVALMLEKQSVVSFRLPESAPGKAYRTGSVVAKTRVEQIQVKSLPDDTFKPPKGFSKLVRPQQPAPEPTTPGHQDQDHTIEIMAPMHSGHGSIGSHL